MQIDLWTLALQAINVLVLAWLLGRFFFRPLTKIIEARRQAAGQALEDAKAAEAKAHAQMTEIVATRAGFAEERKALLDAAQAEIAAMRAAGRKEAEQEAAAVRAATAEDGTRLRRDMEERLGGKAADLAVVIATRLLAAPPPAETAAGLAACLDSLGDHDRDLLAAAVKAGTLTLVTAHPLGTAARAAVNDMLRQRFDTRPAEFSTDPALVAGWRIQADTLVLHQNWGEALSRIGQDMKRDDDRQFS